MVYNLSVRRPIDLCSKFYNMKYLFLIAAMVIVSIGFTQNSTKQLNLDKGVAIQGYDPVSYFTKSKAEKGKSEISAAYQGATYYFSSQANKSEFLQSPSKYEPQYGGWCAFAMADGKKVEINPETFKILDGKLYLFYNAYFNNTLKSWDKNEKNLKAKADKNWINLIK